MAIFLTGITGYIGSYVANNILREHDDRLVVLVRADSVEKAHERMWKSLQLHMDFDTFAGYLSRFDVVLGDLTSPNLGLDDATWKRTAKKIDSVLHIAASLNRKSSKACFNVNLRGTLSVVRLARNAADDHGLRRFSDVSTVAVCGHRQDEVVMEGSCVDWSRSDYDPYARTKKFCEHMVHELLPDVPITVFRPSTVLGDSRFPETTQFEMMRAVATLAYMRVLPLNPDWRFDIVPANYVGRGISTVHMADKPKHDEYHLSSGVDSLTYRDIVEAVKSAGHKPRIVFAPRLGGPFSTAVEALMSTPRQWGIAPAASLMKVFWPYLVNNTVFDNSHIVDELGDRPVPFSRYVYPVLRFCVDGGFKYQYLPWPRDGRERLAKEAAKVA